MPNAMRCPKCYNLVELQHGNSNYWCSCGRHWRAPHQEPETPLSAVQSAIDIPENTNRIKTPEKGRISTIKRYEFATRSTYLHQHGITEVDILLDENNLEYWIKDNFNTGESQRVYIPPRLRKAISAPTFAKKSA